MNEKNFQTIQSIGRPALIKKLTASMPYTHKNVVKGVGDDTAVVKKDKHTYNLLTSESFVEGVDFDLTYMPLHHLGYKVLSALVSDIYAMNGRPDTALVNLAVPNKISTQMLEQLYEGVHAAERDYELQLVGGDLTASHQTLAISVSGTGRVASDDVIYRKGAKPGDAICISGDLGGAIAGLRILMREKKFFQDSGQEMFQPDLDDYKYVVKRQLVPIARKEVVQQFAEMNIIPTAMIDITQGVANDLQQLAAASEIGAYLYQAALPISLETRKVADEMKEDADKYALYGGEDMELLFTLPERKADELVKNMQDITIIGRITDKDEGIKMQTAEGDTIHFENSKAD